MKIKCGNCGRVSEGLEIASFARYKCTHCEMINEVTNIDLREWINFNYNDFLQSIEGFIKSDDFAALKASNEIELLAGKLSEAQIDKLRNVLIVSFNEGLSIRDISRKISKEVGIKDLKEIKDGVITDKVIASAERRPLMIARTESTRVAAEGTLLNYKNNDITEVSYLASTGTRTCDICSNMNGEIMSINEAKGLIPQHPYCRCTFIPIVQSNINNNIMIIEATK